MGFADKTLTCRDCGAEFVWTAGEQEFYKSRGLLNEPGRCPNCRATRRQGRTGTGPKQMSTVICSACGAEARVPFAPRGDRPVYCSTCFDKVRAGQL